MANGGTLVPGTGGRVVLLDYQGLTEQGGGLVALNLETGESQAVVAAAPGGRRFPAAAATRLARMGGSSAPPRVWPPAL